MNSNQKGFGAVEGLLILVIVGLIGFVGWYVWHSKNQADKSLNTAANTEVTASSSKKTTTPPPAAQKQAGTILKSADDKVSITLPDGYTMRSRDDGGQYCGFATSDPTLGTCITDIAYQKGSDEKTGGYVKIFKTIETPANWHKAAISMCNSPQTKTIGGNPELICGLTAGHDYTISNGQYVAYFASDESPDSLSVISSVQFN